MKQLISIISCSFIILNVYAQDQTKSFFVTTYGGFSLSKQNDANKSNRLQIGTGVNYLLNKKWAVGVLMEYGKSIKTTSLMSVPVSGSSGYTTYYSSSESKYQSGYVGLQARYYSSITDKISFFGETQAGLKFESADSKNSSLSQFSGSAQYNPSGAATSSSYNSNRNSSLSAQWAMLPGIVYFIKPRLGLELKTELIRYTHVLDNSMLPEGAEQAKSLSAEFNLANSKAGFSYYF